MAIVILVSTKCNDERNAPMADIEVNCSAKEAIGKWLELGIPSKPDESWQCGADVVWPVLNAEFFVEPPMAGIIPYVCRHMIDAGD